MGNGTRRVAALYIDHTARVDRGGFVIKDTENCIKQTTGWARYCISVEAEAEVVLEVSEEAHYEETVRLAEETPVAKFIGNRAKLLLEQKVIDEDVMKKLHRIRAKLRLNNVLTALTRPNCVDEEHLISWEQTDWRRCNADLESVEQEVRTLLAQVRDMQRLDSE